MKETDAYLGGALPSDFTPQWGLNLSETFGAKSTRSYVFVWYHEGTDFSTLHSIYLKQKANSEIQKRLLCYRLLDVLPDEAIDETFEMIGRVYKFYQMDYPLETPALPEVFGVSAKLGSLVVRPEFPITENE